MSWDHCGEFCKSEILCGHFNLEDGVISFSDGEVDSWKIGTDPIVCIIKNYFNECLTAEYKDPNNVNVEFKKTGNSLEDESIDQQIFALVKYKELAPPQGLSVVFTVSFKERKFHLHCTLEKEINFKAGQSPTFIEGNKSDIIFFAKQFSVGHDAYKFESSLHKNHYLAIKEENGKRILYLKLCPTDVVDESTRLDIHLQNRTI
ncbi:interleukin-18 [Lithobates pipiens]